MLLVLYSTRVVYWRVVWNCTPRGHARPVLYLISCRFVSSRSMCSYYTQYSTAIVSWYLCSARIGTGKCSTAPHRTVWRGTTTAMYLYVSTHGHENCSFSIARTGQCEGDSGERILSLGEVTHSYHSRVGPSRVESSTGARNSKQYSAVSPRRSPDINTWSTDLPARSYFPSVAAKHGSEFISSRISIHIQRTCSNLKRVLWNPYYVLSECMRQCYTWTYHTSTAAKKRDTRSLKYSGIETQKFHQYYYTINLQALSTSMNTHAIAPLYFTVETIVNTRGILL